MVEHAGSSGNSATRRWFRAQGIAEEGRVIGSPFSQRDQYFVMSCLATDAARRAIRVADARARCSCYVRAFLARRGGGVPSAAQPRSQYGGASKRSTRKSMKTRTLVGRWRFGRYTA